MLRCPYCHNYAYASQDAQACPKCGHQLTKVEGPEEFAGGFVSEWSADREQDASDLYAQHVAQRLGGGEDKGRVVKELVNRGWEKETAKQFVDDVDEELKRHVEEYKRTPAGRQAMAAQYRRRMLYGFLWAAGGTAVTIGTYEAASEGGFFFIAWGAIIFGIIDFLRGLFGWLKYRD